MTSPITNSTGFNRVVQTVKHTDNDPVTGYALGSCFDPVHGIVEKNRTTTVSYSSSEKEFECSVRFIDDYFSQSIAQLEEDRNFQNKLNTLLYPSCSSSFKGLILASMVLGSALLILGNSCSFFDIPNINLTHFSIGLELSGLALLLSSLMISKERSLAISTKSMKRKEIVLTTLLVLGVVTFILGRWGRLDDLIYIPSTAIKPLTTVGISAFTFASITLIIDYLTKINLHEGEKIVKKYINYSLIAWLLVLSAGIGLIIAGTEIDPTTYLGTTMISLGSTTALLALPNSIYFAYFYLKSKYLNRISTSHYDSTPQDQKINQDGQKSSSTEVDQDNQSRPRSFSANIDLRLELDMLQQSNN